MCTFHDDRTVEVCDVAIGRVRAELQAAFGERVRFTSRHGEPTLVEATADVDAGEFTGVARRAIDAAQTTPPR